MAYIKTTKANVIGEDAKFRQFALDAVVGGSEVKYMGDRVQYLVYDNELPVTLADILLSDPETKIDDYWIKRWVEVADLDAEIPSEFPNSTVEDGDDAVHRKWSDVVSEATLKIGDKYYPEVAYALSGEPRGLTYSEFKAISTPLLNAEEVRELKNKE